MKKALVGLVLVALAAMPAVASGNNAHGLVDQTAPVFERRAREAADMPAYTSAVELDVPGEIATSEELIPDAASLNVASACLFSACAISGCFFSGCAFSACVFSYCFTSSCLASECVGSGCASACDPHTTCQHSTVCPPSACEPWFCMDHSDLRLR